MSFRIPVNLDYRQYREQLRWGVLDQPMGAWGIFPDSLSIFGFRKLFKIAHPSAFINLDQGLRSFLKTKWTGASNAPAHSN
jgi:hypothetical protein